LQTKVVEEIKTHILCSFLFFPPESLAVYEITWKKVCTAGQATHDIRRMRIACWLPKTTNTHSEYVILIAFPLQQLLRESASLLRYTDIAFIVQFSLEESRGQTPRLGHFILYNEGC
jgi:hypothetical protein